MKALPYLILLVLFGAGCGSSDAASAPQEWVWDLPDGHDLLSDLAEMETVTLTELESTRRAP